MPQQPQLLLATNNAGKIAEFRHLLDGCDWQLVTPRDLNIALDVDETGQTYLENATLKALAFANASGLTSLADDSGLEVDALDGRPGIFSARYAGTDLTDGERVAALLEELASVSEDARTARFRCVIAIARNEDDVRSVEGTVEGRIAVEPRGENGFGYDPIFELPVRGLTVAELSASEKHAVSHRGVAAREARKLLENMLHDD
jgi:XTP/dITP diphosphohydrolase